MWKLQSVFVIVNFIEKLSQVVLANKIEVCRLFEVINWSFLIVSDQIQNSNWAFVQHALKTDLYWMLFRLTVNTYSLEKIVLNDYMSKSRDLKNSFKSHFTWKTCHFTPIFQVHCLFNNRNQAFFYYNEGMWYFKEKSQPESPTTK